MAGTLPSGHFENSANGSAALLSSGISTGLCRHRGQLFQINQQREDTVRLAPQPKQIGGTGWFLRPHRTSRRGCRACLPVRRQPMSRRRRRVAGRVGGASGRGRVGQLCRGAAGRVDRRRRRRADDAAVDLELRRAAAKSRSVPICSTPRSPRPQAAGGTMSPTMSIGRWCCGSRPAVCRRRRSCLP